MLDKRKGHLAATVGRVIAKRRVAKGLTQEQVAERLMIGVEAVSRIERGIVLPTMMRLAELADIYECSIADLVTETSVRTNDQADFLIHQLARLDAADRILVLEVVERLIDRLGRPTS